jgi:ABC-2 type transport system permease protein
MSTHYWFVIARHEYVTNVRRREFILITLGLPFLFLFFGGLSLIGTTVASGAFQKRAEQHVGVVDRYGALDLRAAEQAAPGLRLEARADAEAARQDVRTGKLDALVVLDRDYLGTGRVTVYRKSVGLLNQSERIPLGAILTRGLLARDRVDPRIVRRAVEPAGERGAQVFVLDRGRFVPRSIGREAARFAVPYGFAILLTTAIFIAANYLLRGISDEKENRVIEVILSSVSAGELLAGKLIGLAGVGLTQVAVWVGLGAVPAMIRFAAVIRLSPLALLGVALFFLLGFALYATLMAGLGALGTSYRESQQIAGVVSMGAFLPIMFIPALIEYPNGGLARGLSFFPFTAPTTMVLRLTAADVPLLDILLSAALIALAAWLVLKISAKLFRYGLLIYGKRPSFRETLRLLRQA